MGLHQGIDTVAVASNGVWSKTYGHGATKSRCNLFASLGFLEDAPGMAVISAFAASLIAMPRILSLQVTERDLILKASARALLLRTSARGLALRVESRILYLMGIKRD
jgi:hypothetical protein